MTAYSESVSMTPGQILGRYRLVERIGQRGMGEVWKAHDARLDGDVAIRMRLSGTRTDNNSLERFRRHALGRSRLSHPRVATIFDVDSHDGCDLLVMEYVSGGTVESRVASGPLAIA